ncbi:peptidylprolyl isomerase [Terriglobus roseus]|uniref:Peptidyl-prolyl cis-trans isomerase SurA n=1 Tax=Terriglobus roseus TaxID=392734 RepID=A0A1H4L2U8_9BACT|nr:peptidylprolyl isomerase [Terriglobus roseus]SEB64718.1 peptidyl-prolyl cis-trans isomerase SurA [Terriglobus roseus]
MTESTRLFRAGIFAGLLLSTAAVSVAQQAPAAAPSSLPVPRYQSPGVPQAPAPAPVPEFNLPQTPAITPNATVVEDVIVRVNDGIISRSDLERAEASLQQELAQNPGAAGDATERQKNLLRDLIDQQLLLSKGKELGINPDAEVIRRLDEIRKQNNLPSMEALEAAARSQGVSFEDFKANIRNSIITGQVVRDEVGRSIRMNRADEQKYYDAHKQDFVQPEQVRLSEILVPTAANADDTQIAAALKSSQQIYDKLKAGADFAATAKASSGGPTAAQGGDLGLFKHGALAPVLEEKTFSLPVGGFTEPTRTRQGFVILKAVEHQQAGSPPLAQIEGEVQNAMYQEAIQPALRAYLTRLREEAFIDLRAGFVDSGGSAKQTKPVFAAYIAPVPKKKTEKQRMDAAAAGRMAQQKSAAAVASAAPATQELDKHGKPKKVKREKVRMGQAPRTALPDAPETAEATTDAAAPGAAISPLQGSANTISANAPDEDALTPKQAPRAKTRYASREPEVKQAKIEAKTAKIVEKAKATPIAATSEEKQTQNVQAQALGLNGSNAKKQKVKRKKGDPKDRLQTKPVEPKAPLNDNGLPDRLHQVNAPTRPDGTKVTSDSTTLPPANQPAPGSTLPSPAPAGTGAAPTSNQPVPQP